MGANLAISGTAKVEIITQILKHISDTPTATRPWNVAKAKTVAYNEMALQLLALQCFSDLSTKPALSTVNDYLHKIHEESLKSALEYAEILSVMAFETPPPPYTLWKTSEDEVLELGSIKSSSLLFFNFTERQLADINNADFGTEERATVRTSLKFRELMIDLGQQELRASPEETATGRKRVQGEEKVEKDALKVVAMNESESWANATCPDDYTGNEDYNQKRPKRPRNDRFLDNQSSDQNERVIGLPSTRENDNNVFENLTSLMSTWEEAPTKENPYENQFNRALEAMEAATAQNASLFRIIQQGQQSSSSSDNQVMTTPASNKSEIVSNEKSCASCTMLNGNYFIFCSACGNKL